MKIVFVILTFTFSLASVADSSKFQKKGYIQNDSGQKCWYTQTTNPKAKHFHSALTSITGTLTFDDPKCMQDSGNGLDINKMMINNVIARWYSHADAGFQTRVDEMYDSSILQVKGECIQSKKYPTIGIAIDYSVRGGSIVKVLHGNSVQGCTK